MSAAEIIAQARVERDRLVQFLTTIEEVRDAQAQVQRKDLSDAEEFLALQVLVDAEDRLIALVTDPAFPVYFQHIERQLAEIVECTA